MTAKIIPFRKKSRPKRAQATAASIPVDAIVHGAIAVGVALVVWQALRASNFFAPKL